MSFIRFVAPFSVTMPKFLGGLTVQLLLSVAIFALVMRQGAVYGYDSASYIAPAIIRTPLTPWIIVAFRFVFGESWAAWFVTFQTLAVLLSCIYFVNAVATVFQSGQFVRLLIFAIVAAPLLAYEIGNYILTEAVSYALLLVSFGAIAQLLLDLRWRNLILLGGVVAINLLNRPQMIFVYAVYLLALLHFSLREKIWKATAQTWFLLGLVALPYGSAALAEHVWNLARHGSYVASNFTGVVQVAANLLYVSDTGDVPLFHGKSYWASVKKIYSDMDEYKLFAKYRHEVDMNYAAYLSGGIRPVGIYTTHSSRGDVIYWHTLIRELYAAQVGHDISRQDWNNGKYIDYGDSNTWLAVQDHSAAIASTLVRARGKQYLQLLISKLKSHVSVYELCIVMAMVVLPVIVATPWSIFLSLVTVAHVLNLTTVALCTSLWPRLTFYTDHLVLASIVLCGGMAVSELRRKAPPRVNLLRLWKNGG